MSSQPVPSLAQAGSGHWRCPLYERRRRGGGEPVRLRRGMRARNYRRM